MTATDWPAIIAAILAHRGPGGERMSSAALARAARCNRSTITRLRRQGYEPRHGLGTRILSIHAEIVAQAQRNSG